MEKIKERIQELLENRTKMMVTMGLVVILVIVIVVVVNLILANDSGFSGLVITNEEVLKAMPVAARREAKGGIYATLKNDVGVVREGEVVEVTVREYNEEEGEVSGIATRTGRFLVDIEKFQRTYEVYQTWAPGNLNARISTNGTVAVRCPKVSESKYPEAKCWTGWNNYKDKELRDGE